MSSMYLEQDSQIHARGLSGGQGCIWNFYFATNYLNYPKEDPTDSIAALIFSASLRGAFSAQCSLFDPDMFDGRSRQHKEIWMRSFCNAIVGICYWSIAKAEGHYSVLK